MGTETIDVASEEETEDAGAALALTLPGGATVLLEGELGAGKTRFVKGLARGLGLDPEAVVSPTFTLVHTHHAAGPGGLGLVHVDLYRLRGGADLRELGLEELPGPGSVAAIEWPDRLDATPPGAVRVLIEDLGDTRRRITIGRGLG